MSEGWPDFWIRGKKIDLIDLINTVNLIKQIEQIDNITNLGTLDTINTVGTIQKINPQNTDNVVIDRIKLINTIETVNTLDTINTINTVDTINTIDKIKVIHDARIVPNFIQNGSFRTGNLDGWSNYTANVYVEYDTSAKDYVCVLPNENDWISQHTPPIIAATTVIKVYFKHQIDGGQLKIRVLTADNNIEEFTATATYGGTWYLYTAEPTRNSPILAVDLWNKTSGSELRITHIEILRKPIVYQAEKDRTITPYEAETSGEIAAAENTSGYTLTLNKGYAQLVQFMVYVGGAAEIHIMTSPDDANYATLWTKSMTSAGWYTDWDFNAFPYFAVSVPTTDIDVKIWIRAVQI